MRHPFSLSIGATALAVAATFPRQAAAQSSSECISLRGSTACPSFQDAYINPASLVDSWSFFSNVTDAQSFDARFQDYLNADDGYYRDEIADGLQCFSQASRNVTLQWQRTIFCSRFAELSFDGGCGTEDGQRPPQVCQDTCSDFVDSEYDVLNYNNYCAADQALTSAQNATRHDALRRNYRTCTDRTDAATSNDATCVLGIQNEGSCGFGTSTDQLCALCDPEYNEQLPACCHDANTDLSSCALWGHPLASSIVPTQTIATNVGASAQTLGATPAPTSASASASGSAAASATGSGSNGSGSGSGSGSGGEGNGVNNVNGAGFDQANKGNVLLSANDNVLSDGQLAGIIVGCIVGALLLGALLALLFFRRCRKDRKDPEANRNNVYANAPSGEHVERAWMQSDDGMVKSPELGGAKEGKFGAGAAIGAAALGGAAAVGTAAAAAAGKGRDSLDDRPVSAMSGDTGTDGRGTTIPAVKDQYSSHDICTGETVVAIYPYNAALNDEISLQPDDVVTVQRLYDDGWALGRLETGAEGAFPLVCVTSTKGGTSGGSGEGFGSSTGMTSGNEGNMTSSVDGAVTADEGFTSNATGMQRR